MISLTLPHYENIGVHLIGEHKICEQELIYHLKKWSLKIISDHLIKKIDQLENVSSDDEDDGDEVKNSSNKSKTSYHTFREDKVKI